MRIFRIIRDYFFYCGIEKDEYNKLKKDAYVSNFMIWRILHFLMVFIFGALFATSCMSNLLKQNQLFYLGSLIYSVIALSLFFVLKKDSIFAQIFPAQCAGFGTGHDHKNLPKCGKAFKYVCGPVSSA